MNFKFDGSISLNVLGNYLDRSITYCTYAESDTRCGKFDLELAKDAKRALLNVGAKYVARAISVWVPSKTDESEYPKIKEWISSVHSSDPEIIFEACIFETCTENMNTIAVPESVFKAFGKKIERRNFDCSKMVFEDGLFLNAWGKGLHVPDITREETQMWFYYRACTYIDMGVEALHLGQTNLIGDRDKDLSCWTRVVKMIRAYAKENARRHYVLINGHNPTQNFVGSDGVMLVDFNAFPSRLMTAEDEVDHAVSEDNPQRCELTIAYPPSHPYFGREELFPRLYMDNIVGTSPSGWSTDKYPYLVEFDNFGSFGDHVKKEKRFGYDEISWYVNQPQWYRHQTLEKIKKQVTGFNNNGHFAIPGRRTAYILKENRQSIYAMNDAQFYSKGFSDEAAVKEIFQKF